MANKIVTTSGLSKKQILFNTDPAVAVSIMVSDSTILAGSDGKKIVKAGTPLTGSLENRSVAFTKTEAADVVGVLLHDVDVTAGADNGTLLIHGFVDLNKMESETASLITSTIKTALKGNVTFLK